MKYLNFAFLFFVFTMQSVCGSELIRDVKFKSSAEYVRPELKISAALTDVPVIDSKSDEEAWRNSLTAKKFYTYPGTEAKSRGQVKFAYDSNNLYIAGDFKIKDVSKLKANQSAGRPEKEVKVWSDDCADIHISPDGGRTKYQILFNANGALCDMKNGKQDWNGDIKVAASKTGFGWKFESSIKLADLGLDPAAMKPLFINVGKRDLTIKETSCLFPLYGNYTYAALLLLGEVKKQKTNNDKMLFNKVPVVEIYTDREKYNSLQSYAGCRVKIYNKRGQGGEDLPRLVRVTALRLRAKNNGIVVFEEVVKDVKSRTIDLSFALGPMGKGKVELEIAALTADGKAFPVGKREISIEDKVKPVSKGRIKISLPGSGNSLERKFPITFGVPFPQGVLQDTKELLLQQDGKIIPAAYTVTARWSKKGWIKWLLVDCQPVIKESDSEMILDYGMQHSLPAGGIIYAEEKADKIEINNGKIAFSISKTNFKGLESIQCDVTGDSTLTSFNLYKRNMPAGPYMIDNKGTIFQSSLGKADQVVIEHKSNMRVALKAEGWLFDKNGEKLGRHISRYNIFSGQPFVELVHTFIITHDTNKVSYRDIGWNFPFKGRMMQLGGHNGDIFNCKDGDYLLQRDDLYFKIMHKDSMVREGTHAPGWISVSEGKQGGVGIIMRDFWQNYPKELEFTQNGIAVHHWPKHGAEPRHNGKNFNIHNMGKLWFVHEGRELNFKVPGDYPKNEQWDRGHSNNMLHSVKANAAGLAKSHEMLIYFYSGNAHDGKLNSMASLYDFNPKALPDGKWVSESGVLGDIQPQSPEKYRAAEKTISKAIDWCIDVQKAGRDYGMFNYGDAHHIWNDKDRHWKAHRHWRGVHHGWARWQMLLLMRNSDPALFDYAEAKIKHMRDISHCSWAPPEMKGLGNYSKYPGGMCDYKGIVHWHSGSRFHYNSQADTLLSHYYYTGDLRTREIALLHGQGLLDNPDAVKGREGTGRMTSSIALFQETWDFDYVELYEKTFAVQLAAREPDGEFFHWTSFSPGFSRYIEQTGSKKMVDAIIKYERNHPSVYHWMPRRRYQTIAALATGEVAFMQSSTEVFENDKGILGLDDPMYRNANFKLWSTLDMSYFLQEIPYMMYGLDKLKVTEPVFRLKNNVQMFEGNKCLLSVKKLDDGELPLTFTGRIQGGTLHVNVKDISSAQLKSKDITVKKKGWQDFKDILSLSGKG
ncbi:MAG: exo-rhamnogalacturonan lyase family protein, partial [Planctomycetota bacterium]